MIIELQCCWDLFFMLVGEERFLAKKKISMQSADREHGARPGRMGMTGEVAEQLWWTWACLGSQYHFLQNAAPRLLMLWHYLPFPGSLLPWIRESHLCMDLALSAPAP